MAEIAVRDWLADYKALTDSEINSFVNTVTQNNELIDAIFCVLDETEFHKEFLEPVCQQLFSFYRSTEEQLRHFSLFFLPTLIGLYLMSAYKNDKKTYRCIEVLLLQIYNLEVVDSEGKPTRSSFCIPSISKPSIYHEPIMMPQPQLTENALSKLEHGDSRTISVGPFSEVENLNASNRLQVMTVLFRVYNMHIGFMPQSSHAALCKMCTRLINQGSVLVSKSSSVDKLFSPLFSPRIFLSSQLLLEVLQAVYFCMFNGLYTLGFQALNDIHSRAMQAMFSEVLLVTNAIKNSLDVNPSGNPGDGPMGISIAISPTTSTTAVSKAIITNASFRTKKLPDDIPIQNGKDESQETQPLTIINEDNEDVTSVTGGSSSKLRNSAGSSLPKLPVLQLKKGKGKKETSNESKEKLKNADSSMLDGRNKNPKTNNESAKDDAVDEHNAVDESYIDLQVNKEDGSVYYSADVESTALTNNSLHKDMDSGGSIKPPMQTAV